MARMHYEQELQRLHEKIEAMGRRVDDFMACTLHCLKDMDIEEARLLVPQDEEVNQMQTKLEQRCMSLIALQQPLARDLRVITATLKMVTDMERVADQCTDICELLSTVPGLEKAEMPAVLLTMLEKARDMFGRAVDAYLRQDVPQARAVCRDDDEIDRLFALAVRQECGQISALTEGIDERVEFLFIAKYIERMGDHATNIAEWAIFVEDGVHPDLNTGFL